MFKIPAIKLAGFPKIARTSTGSPRTALNTKQTVSPGLAQGSGSLQANEAISYGQVPLQYNHSPVPDKRNVGKPVSQHTKFIVPTVQRVKPQRNAKVRTR
jgi:hypothetical protein